MTVARGAVVFLVGLAVGVAAAVGGPRVAGPYLPEMLRDKGEVVEAEVTRKLREPERLLLTVVTPRGAVLITFTERISEVDLLVAEGDQLTLELRRVEPFVENPVIQSVRKRPPAAAGDGAPGR